MAYGYLVALRGRCRSYSVEQMAEIRNLHWGALLSSCSRILATMSVYTRQQQHLSKVVAFDEARAPRLSRSAGLALLLDESGDEPRDEILLTSWERDGLLEDAL